MMRRNVRKVEDEGAAAGVKGRDGESVIITVERIKKDYIIQPCRNINELEAQGVVDELSFTWRK